MNATTTSPRGSVRTFTNRPPASPSIRGSVGFIPTVRFFDHEAIRCYKADLADMHTTVSGWKRLAVRFLGSWIWENILSAVVVLGFIVSAALAVTFGIGYFAFHTVMTAFCYALSLAIVLGSLIWVMISLETKLKDENVAVWHTVEFDDFGGEVPDDVARMVESVQHDLPEAKCLVHVLMARRIVDPILEIQYEGKREYPAIWQGEAQIFHI